jgi:F-type H+-transporting ATPase subunit b
MPQLNPEFFISQLFWLVLTFTFLFIFLWRISLPRISSVLEKRASKINDDLIKAKQYQNEAEEIQNQINFKLREAKLKTSDLIKKANFGFQEIGVKKLDQLDKVLNEKLEEASVKIEKNKNESLRFINDQIFEITKLTISKISDINLDDNEIKDQISNVQQRINS